MVHFQRKDFRSEMQDLKKTADRVIEFLSPLLPLANSHTVDFIVDDVWSKIVPSNIELEVERLGIEYVLDNVWNDERNELSKFIRQTQAFIVEQFECFRSVDNVKDLWKSHRATKPVKITEFMTGKKLHEVESMSRVIADLADVFKADLVVDIGSGKGYLTSVLALHYRLHVLGIDCRSTNIDGAIRTTTKLERKWKVYERNAGDTVSKSDKIGSNRHKMTKERCSSNAEYYEKYRWRSAVCGDLYKQRIENISKETNVKAVLDEEYPGHENDKVLLVGLHTCGNLAASCLRLFVDNSDTIEAIINVGCCYHLIGEEFATDPVWHRKKNSAGNKVDVGFPMSAYLKNQKFKLGRDARMCGTQNPSKVFKERELKQTTKPLFYRALLQKLLTLKYNPQNLPAGIVGRIAHKCDTFPEYASKAFRKLNVDIQMNCDELMNFVEEYTPYWQKLKVFFLLKTALSPVIETMVLLDRLLFLHEQGVNTAFVTRLFDPVISPRCYAIIAVRNNSSLSKVDDTIESPA